MAANTGAAEYSTQSVNAIVLIALFARHVYKMYKNYIFKFRYLKMYFYAIV